MPDLSFNLIKQLATAGGFSVVGVAPVDAFDIDRDRLSDWQRQGFAGEMEFMKRDPEILSSPKHFLPAARSALVLSATYDQTPVEPPPPGFGRVARYAWGKDYHRVLKKKLQDLVRMVEHELGAPLQARVFSDSVPLMERTLARSGRTGFVGKNTMLITPGVGSFFFLSEIIWDLEITDVPHKGESPERGCGGCSRCISECPTDAFAAPYILNASRCIAYLTIEKRSALALAERSAIGHWIFGCDVCQEVCPFNFTALKTRRRAHISALQSDVGVGPYLNLKEVLRIRTHEEFVQRFGGTAIMRAKREGLLRNAAIVVANTCAYDAVHDLIQAASQDSSAVVRQHAVWALGEVANGLGTEVKKSIRCTAEKLIEDTDTSVVTEATSVLDHL